MSNPEFERAVLRRLVHDKRLTKAKAAEIWGASIGAQRKRPWARQGPLRRLRSNRCVLQPRHRRPCIGELIQIDGRDHEWFEERAERCTLLVYTTLVQPE